jgi:protein FAM32A
MTKSAFLGGALSFKGDGKKSKKKSKKSKAKHKLQDDLIPAGLSNNGNVVEDELTEAERKAMKFIRHRQQQESEKIATKSHRERVEELNEKLGNMTELNDIPRVSAAGNG